LATDLRHFFFTGKTQRNRIIQNQTFTASIMLVSLSLLMLCKSAAKSDFDMFLPGVSDALALAARNQVYASYLGLPLPPGCCFFCRALRPTAYDL